VEVPVCKSVRLGQAMLQGGVIVHPASADRSGIGGGPMGLRTALAEMRNPPRGRCATARRMTSMFCESTNTASYDPCIDRDLTP